MTLAPAKTSSSEFAVAARWTTFIAIGVCVFIGAMLLLSMLQDWRLTPLNSPEIAALKAQLQDRPNDEAIKDRLRQRDLELRSHYFARQQMNARGAWLLVAAGAALVIAMKSHATLVHRPAAIAGSPADQWQESRLARLGVAVSGVTLLIVCGSLIATVKPSLPESEQAIVALPLPPAEELARHWVSFRGFSGDGMVRGAIPEKWDGTTGDGVLWKTEIPLPGHASPVVFGGSVFLSGSDGNLQELICVDAKTGKLNWRGTVPRGTLQKPNTFDDTGYAAPSPATDGVRAYAIFATGDVGAFDYSGRRVWARNLGNPDSAYGYASSLAVHQGTLIVQWDQGMDPEAGVSFLYGLDGATGRQLWKTPRPVSGSWSSPIVSGGVVYTASNPWLLAYDAASGNELWRAKLLDGDVAPSPVEHEGTVYIANDRAVAAAVRAGGSGDVTETNVLWKVSEMALPDMVSPLTDGKRLLLTHGGGELNCLDATTGKTLWTHNVDAMVHASPILVGSKVYLTDYRGVTHVFELADEFKEIAVFPLGEEVTASPAVVDGVLYIRGKEHLYCIGRK